MTSLWWRSWHGAPTDSKWLAIAKRANVTPGIVSAVAWALFDHASQQESARGCIEGFDCESYAAFSGFEQGVVERAYDAICAKLAEDGKLTSWETRQPKREDHSTERVQRHRNAVKRSETRGNAILDKIREDKKDTFVSEFEIFWKARPRREGDDPKPKALKAYRAARNSGVSSEVLLGAQAQWAAENKEKIGTSWIPMTATWLNERRFERFKIKTAEENSVVDLDMARRGFVWLDGQWTKAEAVE